VRAWIGVGTTNAKAGSYAEVLPSGSYTDLYYQCGNTSQLYTITIEGPNGELTHRSTTVTRVPVDF
jgi:hypothetical protein